MFKTLSNLTKAAVGLVVETPASLIADIATLGGVTTNKERPYTATALKKVMENIKEATESDEE